MLEQKNLTLFFSDIKDFTNFAETVSPAELLIHMTNYFEVCTKNIEENGGIIDKFIGDATFVLLFINYNYFNIFNNDFNQKTNRMALFNVQDTSSTAILNKKTTKTMQKYLKNDKYVFQLEDFEMAKKMVFLFLFQIV